MGLNLANMAVQKDSPIPLYYQIKQFIYENLDSGNLQIGEILPPEAEFIEKLGVSRFTVRQALNELVSEGHLIREKGKGTFVKKPIIEEGITQDFGSFVEDMIRKGFVPSTKVLAQKVIAGIPHINEQLQIPADESLIYLKRVRYADEDPVSFHETYLPYKKYQNLMEVDFTKHQSLTYYIEEHYNCKMDLVIRDVEAKNATKEEAAYLDLSPNDAIIILKTTPYINGSEPVQHTIGRFRGDRNRFTVTLHR